MRHLKRGRKLNRTSAHRKALLRNLANAMIREDLIKTTLPKARELRPFIERLVTIARIDTVAHRRLVFSRLRNKVAVGRLFGDIAIRVKDRPGGYTRIVKSGYRTGDAAPMAHIEFVDREKAS